MGAGGNVARRWSSDEDDQLRHLISQGWSTRRIAGVLRRSIDSVYRRASVRWGGIDALRHQLFAVRSGREMLALMGVQQRTLQLWVERGWLRAHRAYGRRSRNTARLRLLVSDEALEEFLAVRPGWVTWEPAQICDHDWRERAEEIRRKAAGRWWRTDELAAHLGIPKRTIQLWVQVRHRSHPNDVIKVAERWHMWVPGTPEQLALAAQRKGDMRGPQE